MISVLKYGRHKKSQPRSESVAVVAVLSRSERRRNNYQGVTLSEPLGSFFDPKAEFAIAEHFRPHWSQAGAIVFITFPTADSIPKEVLLRWEREKQDWLKRHGLPGNVHWSQVVPALPLTLQEEFKQHFRRCRETFLDTSHGECVLRDRNLANIVAEALIHFDGERYRMGDFVVMPNHVHLLAAMASEDSLVSQCDSWLHFTARQINLRLGRKGKFWQQEPFDHLVRSLNQYEYLRKYIKNNGPKAGLRNDEYLYRKHPG
jgi:type I restriction enzyme R subunit